jgi:hypothetical protein
MRLVSRNASAERRAIIVRTTTTTLADLAPGESAYVSPAALLVTPAGSYHIRTDVPVRRKLAATATMHVTRTAAGYIVDITYCTYHWTSADWAECEPHAPVCRVVFGDEFLQ